MWESALKYLTKLTIYVTALASQMLHVLFGGWGCCRYSPTCTNYAKQALKVHGCGWGLGLIFYRLLRCHPFGGFGFDPVPEMKERG